MLFILAAAKIQTIYETTKHGFLRNVTKTNVFLLSLKLISANGEEMVRV